MIKDLRNIRRGNRGMGTCADVTVISGFWLWRTERTRTVCTEPFTNFWYWADTGEPILSDAVENLLRAKRQKER